jgi:ubiquinone/menaquinone biosynthesis C-methylase UbiE
VIALDVSRDALVEGVRVARSGGDLLHPVVADAMSLPLSDECVDAVVTRSVLIYVADKARAAAESTACCARVAGCRSSSRSIVSTSRSRTSTCLTWNRRAAESWIAGMPEATLTAPCPDSMSETSCVTLWRRF